MDFRVELRGADEVLAVLRRLEDPSTQRRALEEAAGYLEDQVRLGFHTATDPWGRPWAPLTSRDGQPLRDTGAHLLGSLTSRLINDDEAEVGFGFEHADVHQFGAQISAKNAPYLVFKTAGGFRKAKTVTIPARPMLPITEDGTGELPADWAAGLLDVITAIYQQVVEA